MSSAVLYIGLIYGITKYELHIKQIICRYDGESEILILFQVFLPCNEEKERLFLPNNPISMQKRVILLSGLFSFFLLINSSCSKNDDPAPAVKTKTQLITTGSWKFDKATASGAGDISTNPLLACYIDNIITFAPNLSGTINEGAAVCTTPAPANFTWSFQNSEALLRLSFTLFPGGSPDFTIISLNETSLVLSQQMTIAPYPTTTIEVSFKH
jgi:Lipocalin-like domain